MIGAKKLLCIRFLLHDNGTYHFLASRGNLSPDECFFLLGEELFFYTFLLWPLREKQARKMLVSFLFSNEFLGEKAKQFQNG